MKVVVGAALVSALASSACGDNISPLADGLIALEPNTAADPQLDELTFANGKSGYLWLHGRARFAIAPAALFAALQVPEYNLATCSLDNYSPMVIADPQYAFAFVSNNEVQNIVTVDWEETWRFGELQASAGETSTHRIRYGKSAGSSLISTLEGSVEFLLEPDGNVEVGWVEHLDAAGGGVNDMRSSMTRRFEIAKALSRQQPVPPCPSTGNLR